MWIICKNHSEINKLFGCVSVSYEFYGIQIYPGKWLILETLSKKGTWIWKLSGNELPSAYVSHGDDRDEELSPAEYDIS